MATWFSHRLTWGDRVQGSTRGGGDRAVSAAFVPWFRVILQVLVRHEVEFIVVEGMVAVFHGAPVVTYDLDVLHARTPENIPRLLAALRELESFYRTDLNRRLSPNESHLVSPGHQLLATKFGTLDVLGTIDDGTVIESV